MNWAWRGRVARQDTHSAHALHPQRHQTRINTAQRRSSVQWSHVEEVLEQLDPEKPTEELLETVTTLRTALHNKPLHSGRQNGEVLRALYRLLDLEDSRLLARVLRLVLIVRFCGRRRPAGLRPALPCRAPARPDVIACCRRLRKRAARSPTRARCSSSCRATRPTTPFCWRRRPSVRPGLPAMALFFARPCVPPPAAVSYALPFQQKWSSPS